MIKNVAIALIVLFVTGCASKPPIYGDFVEAAPETVEFISVDAVKKLANIYPVAHSVFRMNAEQGGILGDAIEDGMRDEGFAVGHSGGKRLDYIFDTLPDSSYRLTMLVGDSSISRLYKTEQGVTKPVTGWTVREASND